jgi:hypothetical protein
MTEQEHTTIVFKANVAAFEKAVDEQFKPALRKAIAEVMGEFLGDLDASSIFTVEGGDE